MEKYAQVERERKFIIRPDQVSLNNLVYKVIDDHYLLNTSLRLRCMADSNGTTYKLTKKTSLTTAGESQITTIYLSREEYDLLSAATAVKVQKVRYLLPFGKWIIALDRYAGPPEELWLAEVEFATLEEMIAFQMPIPFLKEVTASPEYNGFELAKRFRS